MADAFSNTMLALTGGGPDSFTMAGPWTGSPDGFAKGASWAGALPGKGDGAEGNGSKGASMSWMPKPWDLPDPMPKPWDLPDPMPKPWDLPDPMQTGWDNSWESWDSGWGGKGSSSASSWDGGWNVKGNSSPSTWDGRWDGKGAAGSWDGSWGSNWNGAGGSGWPTPSAPNTSDSWGGGGDWWTDEWNKMISTWRLGGKGALAAKGCLGSGKGDAREGREGKGKKSSRKDLNPHAKVFVGGLSKDSTVDVVKEHFQLFFGTVVDVELKYDVEGNFRCFGFVTFEDEENAKKACTQSRDFPLDGKVLECRAAVPPNQRGGPDPTGEACKIYCGGLPKTATPEEVKVYFACKYGPVAHVDFKFDPDGNFRGFCFIIFEDPTFAHAACNNPEGNKFEDRWIDCKPAMRMPERAAKGLLGKGDATTKGKDVDAAGKSKGKGKKSDDPNWDPKNPPEKVFVGGLPRTVTAASVLTHFSQFGQVQNVDLKMDEQGSFRGFGFVIFQEKAAAELACAPENAGRNMIDGKKFDVRPSVRQPELLKGGAAGKGVQPAAAPGGVMGLLSPGTAPAAGGLNAATLAALLAVPGLGGFAAAAGAVAGAGGSPGMDATSLAAAAAGYGGAGLAGLAGGDMSATLQALAAAQMSALQSAAQPDAAAAAQVSALQSGLQSAVPNPLSGAVADAAQAMPPSGVPALAMPGVAAGTADRGTIDMLTAAGYLSPGMAAAPPQPGAAVGSAAPDQNDTVAEMLRIAGFDSSSAAAASAGVPGAAAPSPAAPSPAETPAAAGSPASNALLDLLKGSDSGNAGSGQAGAFGPAAAATSPARAAPY